jgi:predicted transcriptional regulator
MSNKGKVGTNSDFRMQLWASLIVIVLFLTVIFVISTPVTANNPPEIAIIEPDDGAIVNGTIIIWMVAWDLDGNEEIEEVWVKIDDVELLNATYNHTDGEGQWWFYEWNTTEVEDGWHSIRAIAWDGQADAHDLIEVIVDNIPDNNPPHITIIEPDGGATVSGIITIWSVAWDADGNDQIEDVWVKIDSGDNQNATYNHTNGEGQWWYYEWKNTEVEDGWHHITAIVWDGKDDGSAMIEVYVDNVPDNSVPGIAIVEPDGGATVSGNITVWMVAWDEDGNDDIEEVWVRIDDGHLRNATYNHTNGEGQWWYYVWDSTEVEDGWHHISNVEDNHVPGIAIVEPDDGATVSGTITIWMVAWDADGNDDIEEVWVRIDDGHLRNATYNHTNGEGQWWYYVWDTTEVEDGWHHIRAIVWDGKDDGHDVIEVFVDNFPENHAPLIEIVEPAGGATVSGNVTIWMVAWDADGLDDIENVWVRIDGGELRNATYNHTNGEGQWWYYVWDTTEVEDGWHHIRAIVRDGKDDGHDVIEVYVDNIPENHAPGIEIVEPDHGETVSGTIVIWMVAWDEDGLDDIEDVWVRIDDGHRRNATYNHTNGEGQWWYYEWDTTEVEDGWHSIRAIVYDGQDDGHDIIEIYVENTPGNHAPVIVIIDPEDGDTVSGNITIWMVAWDEDGLDDIEDVWVKIDSGELRNATYSHTDPEGQWWFYEWDTTEVEDGWRHVRAIIWDGTDDGSDLIEVYVENHPGNYAPQIVIVEPDHGATVSGTIVIWMVAWDEDGMDDIENVWVRIDGGELRNATYNHTDHEGQWWYYDWDTTEVEDGWHDITAVVYDGTDDGHDIIEVYVDNLPGNHEPRIEIVEPDGGATVSGTITIWMVAWDADGLDDIENVWIRIDGGELRNATYNHTTGEGQWWYYEWDTTEVEDGWHHIRAIVYDGQDDGHDLIEVYVDNFPDNHVPGIEIVEPEHGDTVSGTIVIWMVAWDEDGLDDIEDVWVFIDDGSPRAATYNHTDHEGQWWYYEWNTEEVEDGWHDITAMVCDGEDDGYDVIEVYVDNIHENHPPRIEIMEPEHGDTVGGTVVIWMLAWDADGLDDIENVWVRIDEGDLNEATYNHTTGEGQWWYYEWDTTEVENKGHWIKAIVSDGIDEGDDIIHVHVYNEEGDAGPGMLFLLILLLVSFLVGLSLWGATEVGTYSLMNLIFLPLYTKISKKDVLDHFVRGQIFGYIKINPGDNYTTIKKNLDLNNGTLTYHLNVLQREGLVKSWSDGKHKFFYPQGVKIPGNGVKNPSIHDAILKSIKDSPGITVRDIAAVTGISRQLANYHIRKMAANGTIELERKSFSKSCYPKEGS